MTTKTYAEQRANGHWTPKWTRKRWQPAVYWTDKWPDHWIMEDQDGEPWLVGTEPGAWEHRQPYSGGYSTLELAEPHSTQMAVRLAGAGFNFRSFLADQVRDIPVFD